jgi:hypothetical protein
MHERRCRPDEERRKQREGEDLQEADEGSCHDEARTADRKREGEAEGVLLAIALEAAEAEQEAAEL